MVKRNSNKNTSVLWLALAAGAFGIWLQRKLRSGRYIKPKVEGESRKALVTGASSGIGAAFARELAARGYDLVLVARRKVQLRDLVDEISAKYPVSVEMISADLTRPDELQLVERTVMANGCLDILVNNAGFGDPQPFVDADIERQLDMVRLHDIASVALTRAALPGMMNNKHGGIIFTSSVAAFFPLYGNANYSASKAYLNNFAEAVQLEVAHSGVSLQALCPGFTFTEFHDQIENFDRAQLPWFMWMQSEDVARQSLEALGNGQVIFVPGLINKLIVAFGRVSVISDIAKYMAKIILRR